MTQQEIEQCAASFENVQRVDNMGYIFFFVGDEQFLPFVSIATKDNPGDDISKLDRGSVFRVNIGVTPKTFKKVFPDVSAEQTFDYTTTDVFMPHPHYAAYSYICILNPSTKNEEQVKEYIANAYALAKKRFKAKHRLIV
jgi:hypothetical protein